MLTIIQKVGWASQNKLQQKLLSKRIATRFIFLQVGQVVLAAEAKSARRAKRHLPTRDEQIKSLQSESFDVLIIGGGATGSGCALDACSRGMLVKEAECYFINLCCHLQ